VEAAAGKRDFSEEWRLCLELELVKRPAEGGRLVRSEGWGGRSGVPRLKFNCFCSERRG